MAWQFTNFAESTLASGISAVATSATVASTEGGLFPSSGDFQLVLIRNSDGAREIVKCTARTGDVLTITREQEGTSGLVLVTGDKVELRVTAAILQSYISSAVDIDQSGASVNSAVHTEAAHATTSDIWTGGQVCLLSGTAVTFTDVVDAPQAGAWRYVIANAAHIFTDGATFEVDGNANYTCAANDVLLITAKTVSTFRVNVIAHGDSADIPPSVHPVVNDFRLSLTTAVPVTTSDVTAATNVYLVPHTGSRISLYDGSAWVTLSSAEVNTGTLTATVDKPYDVFAYDSSGTVTLETLVWTNDTTRATAITRQNGIKVKSGDTTRRYLGTFYTSATNQTEDSEAKRFLYNEYNQVIRKGLATLTADRLQTSTSWVEVNSEIQCEFVIGGTTSVRANLNGSWFINANAGAHSIAFDSTTVPEADLVQSEWANQVNGAIALGISGVKTDLAVGYHYATALTRTSGGNNLYTSGTDSGHQTKTSLILEIMG